MTNGGINRPTRSRRRRKCDNIRSGGVHNLHQQQVGVATSTRGGEMVVTIGCPSEMHTSTGYLLTLAKGRHEIRIYVALLAYRSLPAGPTNDLRAGGPLQRTTSYDNGTNRNGKLQQSHREGHHPPIGGTVWITTTDIPTHTTTFRLYGRYAVLARRLSLPNAEKRNLDMAQDMQHL